jgi:hypothetical protein
LAPLTLEANGRALECRNRQIDGRLINDDHDGLLEAIRFPIAQSGV